VEFEPGVLNRRPTGRGGGSEKPECIVSDEFDGLDATEKAAIGAALNRCRALAAKIANELRNKRPQASLERNADVLSTVKGSQAGGHAA
jgi:hypothetical protein